MDPRPHSQKEELIRRLADYRANLKVPDTRQILNQSKNLLAVAGKLPSTMNARPARTLAITAGAAFLLAVLLKPKRRRKKREKEAIATAATKSAPRQILAWSLAVSQPLVRVWLTEQARRWMQK